MAEREAQGSAASEQADVVAIPAPIELLKASVVLPPELPSNNGREPEPAPSDIQPDQTPILSDMDRSLAANGSPPLSKEVQMGIAAAQAGQVATSEILEIATPRYSSARSIIMPAITVAEAPAAVAGLAQEISTGPPTPELSTTGAVPNGVRIAILKSSADAAAASAVPNSQAQAASPDQPQQPDSLDLKALQKIAVEAAKQAGQAYVDAGVEARGTMKLLSTVLKPGPPITLTVDQIAMVAFFLFLGFQLLLLPIFMPSAFRLVYSLVWGLLLGLGLSFMFYYNKKHKTEVNELLSVNLGMKGMCLVAGGLPSWFSISENEKLQWLNDLVVQVWPYVDRGICQMIKDITAQTMPGVLKSLPSGLSGIVKSIGFKHLTFGAAPFRVESIWVSPHDKDSLVMDLSIKWCGDPNITLAIEIPAGQKLCPRVMDITFIAKMRVVLHPLVPRLPGFVALMATVPKPPLIKYRLDFGKAMGGSMAPAAVTPVVNYFMREIITKMLVWPQRLVVPILQETEQDKVEIQKLMRRHQGVLRVCVLVAKELRAQDWGTNDVQVELTTDSEYFEATSIRRAMPVKAATKEESEMLGEYATFNENIYLLVQEPKDQLLRMEAFDIDKLRPTKLLTGQVTQIVNGRALIGRSLVKLADVCRGGTSGDHTPQPITAHLGRGEWGTTGGPGKGNGKVRLNLQYWPFEKLTKNDAENAVTGIVTVRLLKVWGLTAAGDSLSAYVRVTSSANRKEWRSPTRTWTRRGHIARLKVEMGKIAASRERDLREGRSKDAERKARYLEALKAAINGDERRARLTVDMDYTLDSNSMHAIYQMKLTDVIKVKVIESSLLSSAECLGRLDIAVSDIVIANDHNPITGQREYGLYRKKWEEYNPAHPERPIDSLERGILLDEGDGARIWLELRWVPCIQDIGQGGHGEQEDG